MSGVRKRRRQSVVEYRRRFAEIDAVLLEILLGLLRIPSERHRIIVRAVRMLRPGCLTTSGPARRCPFAANELPIDAAVGAHKSACDPPAANASRQPTRTQGEPLLMKALCYQARKATAVDCEPLAANQLESALIRGFLSESRPAVSNPEGTLESRHSNWLPFVLVRVKLEYVYCSATPCLRGP